MKKLIGLLNVVLILGLLWGMSGCTPATTPTPTPETVEKTRIVKVAPSATVPPTSTPTPTPTVWIVGPPPGPPRSGEAPYTPEDPIIDGMATSFEEWAQAHHYPDEFSDGAYSNAGYFYTQNKNDWNATSSRGNSAILPGVTFFLAHDIWGQPDGLLHMFRTPSDNHWNVAEITLPGGNIVECWILAFGDAPDDSNWLSAAGLENSSLIPEGPGKNTIKDVGFIARLNHDPTTDRHWFPGDPEPGDPDWDDEQFYGCFGMWGFNDSFYTTGVDPDPAHSDENVVYEWKFGGLVGEDWVDLLIQCQLIKLIIKDPDKSWIVFIAPTMWIHILPPTPTPTPTVTATPEPEKVTTSTPTMTPTSRPTAIKPEKVSFQAEDGQNLVGKYYPPPACPVPVTVIYFPWVRGDKDDFDKIAALLPPDLSYGALAITPRGCEGGCEQWHPSDWMLDYLAAVEAAKGLPCVAPSPIVIIGSSVGGDGAVYACGREENCVGALSFSAGSYLDWAWADLVAIMVEQGKHVWAVYAQDDLESARLDRPEWNEYYREFVIPGAKHGDQLYDSNTAEIIRAFIESAWSGSWVP
ncbi:MAG: hypothetical protein ACOYZ7_02145 [Chloroflexota bacterium]